jgi:hypothetical protein
MQLPTTIVERETAYGAAGATETGRSAKTYNTLGDQLTHKDVVSTSTTKLSSFNAHGSAKTLTLNDGTSASIEYTARQKLKKIVYDGLTLAVSFNARSQPSSVTISNGRTIAFNYDASGGLNQISDNWGNKIDFFLEAASVRQETYTHADIQIESALSLKSVDPITLDRASSDPAFAILPVIGLMLDEQPSNKTTGLETKNSLPLVQSKSDTNAQDIAVAQNQNKCPVKVLVALSAIVEVTCRIPRSCSPSDSCSQNGFKISARSACITARKTRENRCFNGGDEEHRKVIQREIEGIQECLRLRPKCCKDDKQ